MEWTTALPDWRERIVRRESLLPCGPLFPSEAAAALDVFDALRIVDAPGSPTFGEVSRPWVRDFVAAIFGAYDPETGRRMIRDFFMLISKKNGKSTDAAGIMLTALLRNWRMSAEYLILAPTMEIANNCFFPARDAVKADDELADLLHTQDHLRMITHRLTGATLKVVAADSDTVSGKKTSGLLIDEHWIFGKRGNADAMLREAMGGLVSRPEGFVVTLSTQSDEPPAGVFKTKLNYFRDVRDGKIKDPKSLGVLYEFPEEMIESGEFTNPANFYITNPNLGISVDQEWLEDEARKVADAQGGEKQTFYAKHLNVEIGLKLRNDAWAGARYWPGSVDEELADIEALKARCDVVVVGIDGGGLDDLFGIAVLGRCRETKRWLLWSHAWAQPDVLERRKDIVSLLYDFEKEGSLTICADVTHDVEEVADIVADLAAAKLLPEKYGVGVDAAGLGTLVEELAARGIVEPQLTAVGQGWQLKGAIQAAERKLKDHTLVHGGTKLMDWCVGNAKAELRGSNIVVTKQAAGKAKIDPVVALFNAVMLMSRNPQPARAPDYQMLVF